MGLYPIIPCSVNTASIRYVFSMPSSAGGLGVGYIQINYTTQGSFATPPSPSAFAAAIDAYVHTFLSNQIYFGGANLYAYWKVNTPINPIEADGELFITAPLTSPPPICAEGFCVMLRSGLTTRNGIARIHWPFLFPGDYDCSTITPSGVTRITPVLKLWTARFAVLGVTFRPVIWSRKLNVFNQITTATISRKTMYLRKRSPKWRDLHGGPATCH